METLKKDMYNAMFSTYGVSTCTLHHRNKNRAGNKGSYLILSVLVVMTVLCMTGCGKKKKISYGDTPGAATGTIDLSGDDAVIDIDNIKAEVGEDIDYTSKIDVIADDSSYTVDVNASNVKYDTPGTYNVGYTVKSDKGTYTSNVKVTVTDNQSSKSAGDVQPDDTNSNAASNDNGSQGNQNAAGQPNNDLAIQEGGQSNGDSLGQQENGAQPAQQDNNAVNNQNNSNSGNRNNQSGNNNSGNNNGNSGQNNSGGNQQETSRVLITSNNNTTYKPKNIENAVIELLSGDVVTISCATNKYIVETRTDEATVEKNGHHYHVSKLIVVFNTGAERTLETVEKKID